MPSPLSACRRLLFFCLAVVFPWVVQGQTFAPQGGQYSIAGAVPGDQTLPHLSLKTAGGYVVWEDNSTDGDGLGISARRLDSSLSGSLGNFRVNQQGAADQEKPRVALLNNGGAAFVWQGGKQGFQNIYARFLSPSNTWLTGDVLVNASTNHAKLNPVLTSLLDGTVVVVWSSFGQDGSLQGVYAQRFSISGQKLGGEFQLNQTTPYNQRTPAIGALSDGNFVVVWVSEQQRFENSVDILGRRYNALGAPLSHEFLINTGTNVCANPSVAASSDGGFTVAWGEKDTIFQDNSWDIFVRPFSSTALGGTTRRVNTQTYGDQIGPTISSWGSEYLLIWTSLGQDGSREGVYGQFLTADGSLVGTEFRANTTTVSQQIHPTAASDGSGRFLVVWTSFGGGLNSFDLLAQRYATTLQPLPPPAAPFVTALSASRLSVTWPEIAGFNVTYYELYVDGAPTPVTVTSNTWLKTGLAPSSTHSVELAYVLADGRHSPRSAPGSGATWGEDENSDGLPDDWQALYWGGAWPSPNDDSDGDGVSNRNEFLAGTNPLDPKSVLRTQLDETVQGLFLSWNTMPGLMYQVQSSTNLSSTAFWVNVGTPRFAPGSVDSILVGGNRETFYRIVRLR